MDHSSCRKKRWICFQSCSNFQTKNVRDYHDQVNAETFEKWMKTQLISNISQSSIIVRDNACFHSRKMHKPLTASNNKTLIRGWLEKTGATVPEDLLKVQLMELVTSYITAADTNYVIDTMASESEHGHKVVCLLPYHCQYNPSELIWAQLKGYVSKQILYI